MLYPFFLEEVVDLVHKVQLAYNENLKQLQAKGMLPLFDAGYINMSRQYLTIGVNGLVEAAQFMGKCRSEACEMGQGSRIPDLPRML